MPKIVKIIFIVGNCLWLAPFTKGVSIVIAVLVIFVVLGEK